MKAEPARCSSAARGNPLALSPRTAPHWREPIREAEGKEEAMGDRLARYIEWQSAGRRTGRVAYIVGTQNLPAPSAGAEWQIDSKFNVADEILRDPGMKSLF